VKIRKALLAIIGTGVLFTLFAAAPAASAASSAAMTPATAAAPMGSWIGACYPWNDGVTAGGWCNGNGPNWTYYTYAICERGSNSWITSGPLRWAGDRRQSYSYCSRNVGYGSGVIYQAWIVVFYNSQIQYYVADG